MTIAVVGVVGFAATKAYFTDTETSVGNTFSTGTIDIDVDGTNPWTRTSPYSLTDMKPSQTEYINFTVKNVGTNPVNVWKRLANVATSSGTLSEPECVDEKGSWANGVCTGNTPKDDIDTVIDYDLSVKLYDGGNNFIWHQMLYNKNVTVAQIKDTDMFLGMIPVGWHMDVVQSYHMKAETGNWAQGDTMTFDIVLTGEQLKGTAVLEDKTGDPDWRVKTETAAQGILTYDVKDSKFNFSFTGVVPLASTNYSLIMYEESWSTPSGSGWPRPVVVLGSATSDGSGNVSIPYTSLELNTDLLNAKIWLVNSSDLSGSTMNDWHPADYLFETSLIDYYDADL